jgi:predicted phage terminase large subunit-like protein
VARVADIIGRWRPMRVGIEANAYQDALRQLVQEHQSHTGQAIHVTPVYSTVEKAIRIRKLSPRVEMGVLRFSTRQQPLVAHLLDYPSVAHDDQADSLAGAVQMIADTGRLAQC